MEYQTPELLQPECTYQAPLLLDLEEVSAEKDRVCATSGSCSAE